MKDDNAQILADLRCHFWFSKRGARSLWSSLIKKYLRRIWKIHLRKSRSIPDVPYARSIPGWNPIPSFQGNTLFSRRVGIPHWDRSLFREPICVGNHQYEMVGCHYSLWWCGISFWMVLADMDAWQGALLTLILLKQSCFKK